MKPATREEPASSATQLINFLQRVLRMTPAALWWLAALLLFSLLNIALKDEVWPNTPNAKIFFAAVGLLTFLSIAWLAVNLAWRVANTMSCEPWKTTWRLAAILGCIGVVGLTIVVSLMLYALLTKWS